MALPQDLSTDQKCLRRYTGQGGNDLQGRKEQFDAQQLVRGNKALHAQAERHKKGQATTPIRVFRGYKVRLVLGSWGNTVRGAGRNKKW